MVIDDIELIMEDEEKTLTTEGTSTQGLPEDNLALSGKYDRLLNNTGKQYKLSGMFKDWFLDYSSYVILQRAVPHIIDGLKPVQRRVLHAMNEKDDGSFIKVATLAGAAMQYHPHGDSSIVGAMVWIGQKNLLIDCQGNWGNIITGDSNAAPRYIEARLTPFAKEVVFNPKTTSWTQSYDGRNQEPVELPIKFPLLLAQGAEGIAVGLSSKILPHNFNELTDASIAILEGKHFEIFPDFPTKGYADCSKYMNGRRGGVVKVRAKIEKVDKNTIAITEIPFGKTTQTIIDSILKAKEKGKIKIKKIDDLTTEDAKISITLPNDVSPDKTIDALYAFTDCEISISPNACVIVDNKPQFLGVDDILRYNTQHTKDLLGLELQIRLDELNNNWHYLSLEKIFFENKIYKFLERDSKDWETQLNEVFQEMKKYQDLVLREISIEDINKLVEKPVRKISKFDTKVVDEKIRAIENEINEIRENLDHLTDFTIKYYKNIKKKYGKDRDRKTELTNFIGIAVTRVVNNNAKLYANKVEGFVGINLKKEDNPELICDCSDLSEIIVIKKDGKYLVTKVSDKAFFGKDIIYVGLFDKNDQRTTYNVIYREGKTSLSYAKRFAVTSMTRDKEYDITQGTEGSTLLWFTANNNAEAETVKIYFRAKPKLKKLIDEYNFSELSIKGRGSRGNLVSKNAIQKILLKSKGTSTIGGKDVWFDSDIQRLNEAGRGEYLGKFDTNDRLIAIYNDGSYETSSTDPSNHYQGQLMKIRKYNPNKVYSVIYFDGESKCFYLKRFAFDISDNAQTSIISEAKGSYFVELSSDKTPQIEIIFGGKHEHRLSEIINAEEHISQKGQKAKGKKISQFEIKEAHFIAPLIKEEDELDLEDEKDPINQIDSIDNDDIIDLSEDNDILTLF